MGRRLLRAWAATAAAAVLLVPTALAPSYAQVAVALPLTGSVSAPAAPAAPAPASGTTAVGTTTAPYVEGRVTLSVDSLAPEVLTSEESVTITGSVTNGTDQPVREASLVVQVQSRTEVTVEELELWLAQTRHTQVSQVHVESTEDIAPGETHHFTMTVPAADLPLDDTDQWGPRGVEVILTEGYDTVAVDRTLLLWDPGMTAQASRVTAVVPVAASAAEMTALLSAPTLASPAEVSAEEAQEVTALRQRVTTLLGLAREGVVLAVDPYLLQALGLPLDEEEQEALASATASPSPTASPTTSAAPRSPGPTASATASSDPTASPTARPTARPTDPDPATTVLRARAELAQALMDAYEAGDIVILAWRDADLASLAHLGERDLAASALARAQEEAALVDGALGTDLSSSTTTVLAIGPLDGTTLSLLPDTVTTVIASPGDLPVAEDLFYTPSGTTTISGRAVLVPDEDLSDAASGTSDGAELNGLDARQLLRADTAVRVRQAPSVGRDVIVTVSRAEASTQTAAVLDERIDALLEARWTVPQNLGSLVGSAREDETNGEQAPRHPLPEVVQAEGELSAEDLTAARRAEADLETLATILSDPQAITDEATEVVSASVSNAWRTDAAGRSAYTAAVAGLRQTVTAGLSAAPSSTINVIAQSAAMPVRVVSSLDQDVTVRVHLKPSSTRLQVSEDVEVTVPAQGEATASVPITAVGSGEVTVMIDLLAPDGTRVGTPVAILTRVHADWESMGTRVVAGLLVLVLVVGIVRTVRRGRRTRTKGEA
ncbi:MULTISPECIES: DUF6049 family protein [Actinomyces]|uniref:Conjugal transfer protein n=1 Tax=Actinomyces respiraculi TaxID=2744574 RepID=A0A7T0LKG8_9ACTO|nr:MULTISPECIES: DUF6049 family protein [Actinomyces]QPL05422.1 conjugal transfer protein [Actinomyces respiraculi]